MLVQSTSDPVGNKFPENNCDKFSSLIFVKSKFKSLDKSLFKIISSGDFTGIGACFTKKSSGSFEYVLSKTNLLINIYI